MKQRHKDVKHCVPLPIGAQRKQAGAEIWSHPNEKIQERDNTQH